MATVCATKLTLKISTAIFYFLCLSGLIWQISQISINFFAFDVVSDIKIILPEEKSNRSILNVCFRYPELYNISVFNDLKSKYSIGESDVNEAWKILDEKIKISEIFQVALNHDEIFFAENETLDIQEYVVYHHICYQIYNLENQGGIRNFVYIHSNRLENITVSFLFISQLLPDIDPDRFQILTELTKKNKMTLIFITENSYKIFKLPTPYVDNCINYSILGFRNRNDAMYSCVNDAKLKKSNAIYRGKAMVKSDEKFMNYGFVEQYIPLDSDYIACKSMYSIHDDCNHEAIFTQVSARNGVGIKTNTTYIKLIMAEGNQPSFKIVSKPRIDNIDFITYIFGALGSWFGFTFLACNPIPFISQMQDGSSNSETKAIRKNQNDEMCTLRDDLLIENSRLKDRILILESTCAIFHRNFDRINLTLSKISRQLDTLRKK